MVVGAQVCAVPPAMGDAKLAGEASASALKALRKVVPWAATEMPVQEPSPAAPPPEALPPMVLPAAPSPFAIADFPATVHDLLDNIGLQHSAKLFEGENIVSVTVALVALGPTAFFARLKGTLRIGDRQRLLGALIRATQRLQTATSSLVDSSEARLSGLGPNLLPFVSTYPPSESSAVAAVAAAPISIATVIDSMNRNQPAVDALVASLSTQSLYWLSDAQCEQLRILASFTLLCLLDSGVRAD